MVKRKSGRPLAVAARAEMPAAVDSLFAKVAAILDRARVGVVRSVNSEMLLAYWHIGREIVEALQGGLDRAEYGTALMETLAGRLTREYGQGFSSTNLRYFRSFYQVFADRAPEIRHTPCGEFAGDRATGKIRHTARGVLSDLALVSKNAESIRGFSARLGWAHYRALMSVENRTERLDGSNTMNIASTAYRRVDEAQRNPPNIAGMTHRSSGWWIPARTAPASTLQEALGTRGGL